MQKERAPGVFRLLMACMRGRQVAPKALSLASLLVAAVKEAFVMIYTCLVL